MSALLQYCQRNMKKHLLVTEQLMGLTKFASAVSACAHWASCKFHRALAKRKWFSASRHASKHTSGLQSNLKAGNMTTAHGYFSAFNTEPGLECCVCYMSSNVVLITALVEVEHEWILFLAERCFPYMIKYLCHQEAALILEKYSEILNQCVKSRGQSHTVQALQRTCAAAKDLIGIRSLGIGINREQHEVQQLAAACLRKAGKAKCTQWKMNLMSSHVVVTSPSL